MSLRIKRVSQKHDAGVVDAAAVSHEQGITGTREREKPEGVSGNNTELAGWQTGHAAAEQDDEETEQGPFDDTIGET
ncbi:hypothetical protein K0M31_003904 [Melipona bicolor]|uniref:Uncharacterized protein n=1 Tax=Melipona bicolor TaxID=60889 RepID=A0AA40KNX8_9HYME|nr:hypothetical protein K0M31_003904 [Melipona bicolor]